MAADLDWIFEIVDKASKPLANIDEKMKVMPRSLKQVEEAFKRVDAAARLQDIQRIRDPLKQARAMLALQKQLIAEQKKAEPGIARQAFAYVAQSKAVTVLGNKLRNSRFGSLVGSARDKVAQSSVAQRFRNSFDKVSNSKLVTGIKARVGDLSESLSGKLGPALAGVAGPAAIAAAAMLGVYAAVGYGAISLIKLGIEASESKRAMLGALDVFEGARSDKAFSVLQDFGIAAGVSADRTVQAFADLRAAGFESKNAQDILAASFDVSALKGGGEAGIAAAQKFQDLFVKFSAVGKVSSKDLTTLARDVGIAPEAIAEGLAKRTKISVDAAKKALEAGKADAVDVQNTLLDVVSNRSGGALGSRAKALADGSVTGQLQRIKDLASNLLEDVNIAPFANALGKVTEFLRGDGGERIKRLAEGFFNLFASGQKFDLERVMRGVVDIMEKAVGVVEDLSAGFGDTFKPELIEQILGPLNKFLDGGTQGSSIWRTVGMVIGAVAAQTVLLLELTAKVAGIVGKMVGGIVSTVDKVRGLFTSSKDSGKRMSGSSLMSAKDIEDNGGKLYSSSLAASFAEVGQSITDAAPAPANVTKSASLTIGQIVVPEGRSGRETAQSIARDSGRMWSSMVEQAASQ